MLALDGMALAYRDPEHPAPGPDHLLLAPAGRLEAIVTGPPPGIHESLRTRCVNTGPDGDPNPEMVLADLVQPSSAQPSPYKTDAQPTRLKSHASDEPAPLYKPIDV